MKTKSEVDEIRRLLKNINTDEEIDEIHDILDRVDGSVVLQNPQVDMMVGDIIRKGQLIEVEVMNNIDYQSVIGGGGQHYHTGPVEVHLTFHAHPGDIYDG